MKVIQGDCLEKMKDISNNSIDMICVDPPYGTTSCKWDSIIPFNDYIDLTKNNDFSFKSKKKIIYEDEFLLYCFKQGITYDNAKKLFDKEAKKGMWYYLKKVIKPNSAIIMTASQPFTTELINSNIKMFKYCWVWKKDKPNNFALANKRPMKYHEDIVVFYLKQPVYNKQLQPREGSGKARYKYAVDNSNRNSEHLLLKDKPKFFDPNLKNPSSVQYFSTGKRNNLVHPTQKPLALIEYLIKTYTNKNDTVLDFTMGSGTTGVACKKLNRHFIGIELDKKYFDIAKKRINETKSDKQIHPYQPFK